MTQERRSQPRTVEFLDLHADFQLIDRNSLAHRHLTNYEKTLQRRRFYDLHAETGPVRPVHLVYLVNFVRSNTRDRPDRPNEQVRLENFSASPKTPSERRRRCSSNTNTPLWPLSVPKGES